jgi:hypothetical protein
MGFVVGGSVVWSLQPSAPPKTSQTSQQPGKKSAENSYLYDAWEWATHDATSVYTFFLALFTGVVGTTAIVQIRYLKRADETARISADAAKQAADAAVATERARFYVVIDHNFLECTNRAAAWEVLLIKRSGLFQWMLSRWLELNSKITVKLRAL